MPVGELTKELADAAATVRPGFRRLGRIIALVFAYALTVGAIALVRSEMARRSGVRLESALRAEIRAQRSETESNLSVLKGQVAELDEATKQGLTEVLRRVEPSVVMLALKSADGKVRFVGTGWAVGEKQLATNAHVAEGCARESISEACQRLHAELPQAVWKTSLS